MINVDIKKNSDQTIQRITISGHANSNLKSEDDNDLVCSGVSAIAYGILNSLDDSKLNISIQDGFIDILVNNFSKDNNKALEILITSLRTIEEEYKKNILIKEEVI